MKNKKIISFLINILIGILFSFPVFSAPGNAEYCINLNEEYFISSDKSELFSESGYNVYPLKLLGNYHLSYYFSSNPIQYDFSPGNKKNHLNDFTPQFFKDKLLIYYLSEIYFKNTPYVNLSYLKELKTTKMLC